MFGKHNDGGGTAGTCPYCGADLFGNEVFCTQCGQSLGTTSQSTQGPAVVGSCPNPDCGAPIYEGDVFCTTCGMDLGSAGVTPPAGNGYGLAGGGPTVMNPLGGQGGPVGDTTTSAPLPPDPVTGIADDDTPTARPMMVRISREEARMGCRKTIEVDGQQISVDIPAGVGIYTKLDVPNLGYFDEMTGDRGPLRLSFRIV